MGSRAGKPLTDRELEVLKMAACGLSNARITAALHLFEAAVKRHLANVYEKLGESSRNEAVSVALAGGGGSNGQTSCCPMATVSPRGTARCKGVPSTVARRPVAGARSWRCAPRPHRTRARAFRATAARWSGRGRHRVAARRHIFYEVRHEGNTS